MWSWLGSEAQVGRALWSQCRAFWARPSHTSKGGAKAAVHQEGSWAGKNSGCCRDVSAPLPPCHKAAGEI